MGSAIFVMISGYILMQKEFDYYNFYQTRAKRLLIPLLFWSLFYAIFSLIYFDNSVKNFIWRISAGLFLSGKTYFHLWYLSMFFCLMMIAPFINKWVFGIKPSSRDLVAIVTLGAIFFGISSISQLKEAVTASGIEWHKNFGIYIFYFILGHLIGSHIDNFRISVKTLLTTYISIIVTAIGLNYFLAINNIRDDNTIIGNDTVIGFLATCTAFTLAAKLNSKIKNGKLFNILAPNGFGIYLIHPFVLFFSFKTVSAFIDNNVGIMFLAIVTTACLSYLLTAALRKTYFGRLIT